MLNLKEYIKKQYRYYARLAEEESENEDYEQAAYDSGKRAAYYDMLQKLGETKGNENYR